MNAIATATSASRDESQRLLDNVPGAPALTTGTGLLSADAGQFNFTLSPNATESEFFVCLAAPPLPSPPAPAPPTAAELALQRTSKKESEFTTADFAATTYAELREKSQAELTALSKRFDELEKANPADPQLDAFKKTYQFGLLLEADKGTAFSDQDAKDLIQGLLADPARAAGHVANTPYLYIEKLKPEQMKDFPVHLLTPERFAQLSDKQLSKLTPAQVISLKPEHLEALKDDRSDPNYARLAYLPLDGITDVHRRGSVMAREFYRNQGQDREAVERGERLENRAETYMCDAAIPNPTQVKGLRLRPDVEIYVQGLCDSTRVQNPGGPGLQQLGFEWKKVNDEFSKLYQLAVSQNRSAGSKESVPVLTDISQLRREDQARAQELLDRRLVLQEAIHLTRQELARYGVPLTLVEVNTTDPTARNFAPDRALRFAPSKELSEEAQKLQNWALQRF